MLGLLVVLQVILGAIAWRRCAIVRRLIEDDRRLLAESGTNGATREAINALAYTAKYRLFVSVALTIHPLVYLFSPMPYRRYVALYATQVLLIWITVALALVVGRQSRERAVLRAIANERERQEEAARASQEAEPPNHGG